MNHEDAHRAIFRRCGFSCCRSSCRCQSFQEQDHHGQEGGTERAVVTVKLGGESPGKTDVLTATRTDFSAGVNSQNFPEIANRVIIAGPAEVSIQPIVGAKLFITYKKERDEGSGGGGGGASPTVIPIFSPTPGVTATPTATPFIFPTPFGG